MEFSHKRSICMCIFFFIALTACASPKPAKVNSKPQKTIAYKPIEIKRKEGQSLERYFASVLRFNKFQCENKALDGYYSYIYESPDSGKISDELNMCVRFARNEADKTFKELISRKNSENMQIAIKNLYTRWNVLMSELSIYEKPLPAAELSYRNASEAYETEIKLNQWSTQ